MTDDVVRDEEDSNGHWSSEIQQLISEANQLAQEIESLVEAELDDDAKKTKKLKEQIIPKGDEIYPLIFRILKKISEMKPTTQKQIIEIEELKSSANRLLYRGNTVLWEFDEFFRVDDAAGDWKEQIKQLNDSLSEEIDIEGAFDQDPFHGLRDDSMLRSFVDEGLSIFGSGLPPAQVFLELYVGEALVYLRGMLQCLFQYQITDTTDLPELFIGKDSKVENLGDFAGLLLERSAVLTMHPFHVREEDSDSINNMLSQLNFVLTKVADVIKNLKVGKGRYTTVLSDTNSHAIVNKYRPHRPYKNKGMWPAKRDQYYSLKELDIKNWLGREYHSQRVITSVESHPIVYRDFLDFIQGLGFVHKKVTAYDGNKRTEPQLTTFEWGGIKRKYRDEASIYFYNENCPISQRELRLSVDSDEYNKRVTLNIGVESFRPDVEDDGLSEDAMLMKMRDRVEAYTSSLLEQFVEHQKEHGLLKNAKFSASMKELKLKGRSFDDLIISSSKRELLDDNIFALLRHAEAITGRGVDTNRGIMLAGPPGVGKSLTVDAIVDEGNCTVLYADFQMLQKQMDNIFNIARKYAPTILILEDIDALGITGQRGLFGMGSGLSDLLNNMDGINSNNGVITVATSNHPEHLDWALIARPGRFDVRIDYAYPDHELLLGILKLKLKPFPLQGQLDLEKIVKRMPLGFTGSHIQDIVNQSNYIAINQSKDEPEKAAIAQAHLEMAFERSLYNFNKFLSERPHVTLTGTPSASDVIRSNLGSGDHQFG